MGSWKCEANKALCLQGLARPWRGPIASNKANSAKPGRQPGPIVRNKPNWARGKGSEAARRWDRSYNEGNWAAVPGENRLGATGDKRISGGDARTTKKRLAASLRTRRLAPRAKQSQFGPVATGWGRRRSYSISGASPCLRKGRLWPRGDDPAKQSQFQRESQVGSVEFQAKRARRPVVRVIGLQTSHFKLAARETQVIAGKGLMTNWARRSLGKTKQAKSPWHRMVPAV